MTIPRKHATVNYSTAIPQPVGAVGSPGDLTALVKAYSLGGHIHAGASASDVGGKLFTAMVPDRFKRVDVDACFIGYYVCPVPVLLDSAGWTQIATGVWRKNVSGDLSSQYTDDIPPFQGMRLLVWPSHNAELMSTADRVASGIYELTDTGHTTGGNFDGDPVVAHYATLRRAADASAADQVYSGIWTSVVGGTACGGRTYQLSTADPIELNVTPLTWSSISPPAVANSDSLLTSAQLSLASPDTVIASTAVSAGLGEMDLVTCQQRDAVLGGTILPGTGKWVAHLLVSLASDDPAATTVVKFWMRGTNGSFQLIATSPPLHNTTPQTWVLPSGTLGADYRMAVSEKLEAKFTVTTTSSSSLEVSLVYNDAGHSTFIEVPVVLGYAGTDEHDKLTPASRALPDQHPFSAITPGFLHTPTTQITTVDGLLDLSTAISNTIDLRGTEPLVGISTAGILDGDGIEILVMDAVPQAPDGREYRSFTNQGVIDPIAHPGYCSMNFGTLGRGVPPSSLDLRRESIIALRLSGGEWRLRYLFESENT